MHGIELALYSKSSPTLIDSTEYMKCPTLEYGSGNLNDEQCYLVGCYTYEYN